MIVREFKDHVAIQCEEREKNLAGIDRMLDGWRSLGYTSQFSVKYNGVDRIILSTQGKQSEEAQGEKNKRLRLVNIENKDFILEIDKDEYILGKSEDMADGYIPISSAVSRKHCKICKQENGDYIVQDLGSLNGTFLDGQWVSTENTIPLKTGNILKMADLEFRVELYLV